MEVITPFLLVVVSFVVVICMTASVAAGCPRRLPEDWFETYEAVG